MASRFHSIPTHFLLNLPTAGPLADWEFSPQARSLNNRLPADIAVMHAAVVGNRWVPYACVRKRYRYMLLAAPASSRIDRIGGLAKRSGPARGG